MRNTGQMSGLYTTLQDLVDAGSKNNQRVELLSGERYQTGAVDAGGGVLLSTGNYANIIPTVDPQTAINKTNIATNSDALFFDRISTPTNLFAGKKYLSTATSSHVVPAASGGEPIVITWLAGTIMTLTSASDMSVITNIETTDTTWVFEGFIQTLTLVDTGTEWEIK